MRRRIWGGLLAAGPLLLPGACLAIPAHWSDAAPVTTPAGPDADDWLDRAAASIAADDKPAAVAALERYAQLRPNVFAQRVHLAELYAQLDRPDDARLALETLLADLPAGAQALTVRPHCHTRLMKLAEARGDEFAEHLHRAGGLLALVEKWDADAANRDEPTVERTLSQALTAARRATELRPESRAAWEMLAAVFSRLDEGEAAEGAGRRARGCVADISAPTAAVAGQRRGGGSG